jgi:hypothetical protein
MILPFVSRRRYEQERARIAQERDDAEGRAILAERCLGYAQDARDAAVAAKEAVESERDWLRSRVEGVEDALIRIQRREHGMSEVPHNPPAKPERIPDRLREYLMGISSKAIRGEAEKQMYRDYAKYGTWEPVIAETFKPKPAEEADE